MFKRKIKTELEVFSEQRYKDAAVVIYHQLKKRNQHAPNEKPIATSVVQGWMDEDTVPTTQHINETPQTSIVEHAPGNVQSKFCTLM